MTLPDGAIRTKFITSFCIFKRNDLKIRSKTLSQTSMNENLTIAEIESLSFDSFARNPEIDIVCLDPIRTIIRREEEVTLVRKVEEIESAVACPVNSAPVQSGGGSTTYPDAIYPEITVPNPGISDPDPITPDPTLPGLGATDLFEVDACEDRQEFVSRFVNTWGRTIRVRFETSDTWNYGGTEGYVQQVDGDGHAGGAIRDARFPNAQPCSLVSFRNGLANPEFVASGKVQTVDIQPGETLFFINNDQPGYYGDNSGRLVVRWTIVG